MVYNAFWSYATDACSCYPTPAHPADVSSCLQNPNPDIKEHTQSTAVVVVVVVSVIRHPSSVVVVVVVVVADKKISPRSLQKDHDGRCCLTERLGLATHV